MKLRKILISLLLVCYQKGFSMPVEDPGEWFRTMKMYSEEVKQYQTLQDQYTQMKQQYAAVTGNYGWGNWNNGQSDLTQREWAAGDWQSALQGMSGGNADRYNQLLAQYKQSHASMTPDSYAKGADQTLSTAYQNQVQTNQASATTTTYEFNDINNHLNTLFQLGKQIENASQNNDLKSAVDLNSRVNLEVAYISIEELRMQTVLNQQASQEQADKISQENEASQFNQAGVSQ